MIHQGKVLYHLQTVIVYIRMYESVYLQYFYSVVLIDSISAANKNKYGDIGSPCLHPLSIFILSDKFPMLQDICIYIVVK